MYKTLQGMAWMKFAVATSLFFPGIVFSTGFILNFFVWGKESSGAVPFTTMLALLCIWILVSVPFVIAGAFFGFRKQPYEYPCKTNQIPRNIPTQLWFVSSLLDSASLFGRKKRRKMAARRERVNRKTKKVDCECIEGGDGELSRSVLSR